MKSLPAKASLALVMNTVCPLSHSLYAQTGDEDLSICQCMEALATATTFLSKIPFEMKIALEGCIFICNMSQEFCIHLLDNWFEKALF